MLLFEDTALWIAVEFLTDIVSDPVVRRVPENSCDGKQDENERQTQWSVGGGQCTDGEQQGVAREKWGHNQAGLCEDDQEQEGIDPGAVRIGDLPNVEIQMQDDVNEL